jgi:hypothetical protein
MPETDELFPSPSSPADPDAWVKALSPTDRDVLAAASLPDQEGKMRPPGCTWPEVDDARRDVARRRMRDLGRGIDAPMRRYIEAVVQERIHAAAKARRPS